MDIDFNNLDPQVVTLAKAIRTVESNGNYEAKGDSGHSSGAYQWYDKAGNGKAHFAAMAKQFGLDGADFSPVNQDKVAYAQMKAWKDSGYHAGEIAAMWNSGQRNVNKDVPYVSKVQKALGSVSSGPSSGVPGAAHIGQMGASGVNNLPGPAGVTPLKVDGALAQTNNSAGQQVSNAALPVIQNHPAIFGFPSGLATQARVFNGEVDADTNAANQDIPQQMGLLQQLHKLVLQGVPKTDPRRIRLINAIKRQSGLAASAPTEGDVDPGTKLTNKQVLSSAGLTGLALVGAPIAAQAASEAMAGTAAKPGLLSKGVSLAKKGAALYTTAQVLKHTPAKGLLKLVGQALE